MKVFISWSGERSRVVAEALQQWLPDVIQSVEPWMSAADLEAGVRWNRAIDTELSETQFGIICLTQTNTNAPWILFEAGALAKTIEETFVCPYLIDLEPTDIARSPLVQFQAKRANQKETWELVQTINRALKDNALPEDRLRRTFERWWPNLEDVINSLPEEAVDATPRRQVEDMVEETLELVRGLTRRSVIDEELGARAELANRLLGSGSPYVDFLFERLMRRSPDDIEARNREIAERSKEWEARRLKELQATEESTDADPPKNRE